MDVVLNVPGPIPVLYRPISYIPISTLQDHLKIIRPYDPYTATVCALYFIFGVVCAFFGYRCFKAIMFLYGFIFGSIVVYLICAEEEVLPGSSENIVINF